jgi:hypothetical protein
MNLPNVSYIEHVLPSSILLNEKEVLIYLGGGEIEGSGSSFGESYMEAIASLEHGTYLCLILHLGNPLVFDSYQFHMPPHFFFQSKSTLIVVTLHSWHLSSQCFQVNFCASSCSREVSLQTIHLQYFQFPFPMSIHNLSIHHLTSLSCVNCFSMMGDTSSPSFHASFPIDFNTSSKNYS